MEVMKIELNKAIEYIDKAQAKLSEWRSKVALGNRYYNNEDDIKRTGAAAIDAVNGYLQGIGQNPLRSADNRISTNWHEILTVQKNAYVLTYPPVFTIGKDKELSEEVNDTLGGRVRKGALSAGDLCDQRRDSPLEYWVDSDGVFRMAALEADQCAAFYNPMDIGKETIALVRAYNLQNADGNDVVHYEVWDQQEVVFVNGETMEEEPVIVGGREVTRMPNEFGEIPFIEFANNERKASDLLMAQGIGGCLRQGRVWIYQ